MENGQHRRKNVLRPTALEIASRTIHKMAKQQNTTPEAIRKHIQIAMLNGLVSEDPTIRAEFKKIPCSGDIPTPEEVIAYYSSKITNYN